MEVLDELEVGALGLVVEADDLSGFIAAKSHGDGSRRTPRVGMSRTDVQVGGPSAQLSVCDASPALLVDRHELKLEELLSQLFAPRLCSQPPDYRATPASSTGPPARFVRVERTKLGAKADRDTCSGGGRHSRVPVLVIDSRWIAHARTSH